MFDFIFKNVKNIKYLTIPIFLTLMSDMLDLWSGNLKTIDDLGAIVI